MVSRLSFATRTVVVLLLGIMLLSPVVAIGSLSATVYTDRTQYSRGQVISIMGKVLDNLGNPAAGATVSIQINDPQSNLVFADVVYTDQSGSYSDNTFRLSVTAAAGQYTLYVSAQKSGFNNAQSQIQFTVAAQTISSTSASTSSSSSATTTQTPSPPKLCLIATASYGSELSPEVTLLRSFRDKDILLSFGGRSFMLAFNAFYYSFSPQVASFIAANNNAKIIARTALYPLIGVLYVSSRMFEVLPFNPEPVVLIVGIFAAFAIGGIYGGPGTFLVSAISNKRIGKRGRLMIVSGFIGSITSLLISESTAYVPLAVASSVCVVLFSASLGAYTLSLVPELARRKTQKILG